MTGDRSSDALANAGSRTDTRLDMRVHMGPRLLGHRSALTWSDAKGGPFCGQSVWYRVK